MITPPMEWVRATTTEQAALLLKPLEGRTITVLIMESGSSTRLEPFSRQEVAIREVRVDPLHPEWVKVSGGDPEVGRYLLYHAPTHQPMDIARDATGTIIQVRRPGIHPIGGRNTGARLDIFLL